MILSHIVQKLNRSRDSDHAHFRDSLSSVGWDLPIVGVRKLESLGFVWHCLRDSTFSHFDTIPACDRQTDIRRRLIPTLA